MNLKNLIGKIFSTVEESIPLQYKIKDYYLKHGYFFDEVNLIGIRNSESRGTNKFDDLICAVSENFIEVYAATTDPGTTWTDDAKKKFGVTYDGTICTGMYKRAYKFGKHRGYTALVQNVQFNEYRDLNKNGLLDANEQVKRNVWGGYNLHTVGNPEKDGGNVTKKTVDYASAGCQVIASQKDFLELLSILKTTNSYKKNKAYAWDYLLIESNEFPLYSEIKKLA